MTHLTGHRTLILAAAVIAGASMLLCCERGPAGPGPNFVLILTDDMGWMDTHVYGSTFYVMTGFHGAHVIAGLLMLAVVFVRAFWRDFTPTRHLFVDAGVLYWHFVDIVWVFLYVSLYVLV